MLSGSLELPTIQAVYAQFAALTAWRAELGGALLLSSGLTPEGVAVLFAANIAGAASLGLERDAEQAGAALRLGICDFVVNDLGESLRILKNEVRKRQPVSVVLTGDCETAIREIVERGVQPDVLAFPVPELEQQGAWLLRTEAEDARIGVTWGVAETPLRFMPQLDALAARSLTAQDARSHWVLSSSRYLGRSFAEKRYTRMSTSEAATFLALVRAANLPVSVTVTCGSQQDVIAP